MRNKILMTLALLLTAVTGAWAQDTYNVTFKANGNTKTVENITLPHTFGCSYNGDLGRGTGELDVIIQELYGLSGGTCASVIPESDNASVTCDVDNGDNQYIIVNAPFNGTATVTGVYYNSSFDTFNYSLEISIPGYTAEPAIDVKWDPATKTGNFVMPAFDVVLTPVYAPVAKWAVSSEVDQIPTAIDGIIAGEAKDIVKAGIVAKVGSTENAQGTLMYLVTTTKEQPTSTEGFSATVPTGAVLTGSYAEDQTVYVWYYIKGIDAAEGVAPTAENTFNDSEICTTPLTVTLKANQFDLTLNPAPVKNMTVTVAGQAKTPTDEGKVEAVKMQSEVKLKANTGYKFRKVEVKKTPKQ